MARPKGVHMPTPSEIAKEFCISSSNNAVCGTLSAYIFYEAEMMKRLKICDEACTLLAMSEVANSILLFCEGCNRVFAQAKGMPKSILFMESKLYEAFQP